MNKYFAKDLINYIPSKVLPGVFGILIISVYSRIFSTIEYGQYVIVKSTVSVLSLLSIDWLCVSVIRYFNKYENKQLNFLYQAVTQLTILSVSFASAIFIFGLLLFKNIIDINLYYYLNLGIVLFILNASFTVFQQILVVRRKSGFYSFFTVYRLCICPLIGLILIFFMESPVSGMLLGIIISLILIYPVIFKIAIPETSYVKLSLSIVKKFAYYGIPLGITNISGWILALSDRYIIQLFRGSAEVGLYSISYSIANNSIYLIVSIFTIASAPIIMKKWENESRGETIQFIRNITSLYLIVCVPSTVGLCILAKPILKLLSTTEYYEGFRIIPMVAGSVLLFGLQRNFQLGLLFYKKTKIIMYITFISCLINVILNYIFIPRYGFIAAGFTTLVAYIINFILVIFLSRKFLKWKFPFKILLKIIIASSFMSFGIGLLLMITGIPNAILIILSILCGSFIYFAALYFSKGLNIDDIKSLLFEKKSL